MTKKCCPRVRVVCKRPKATTVTQPWWGLKDELSKPHKHTAKVSVQKEAVCSVKKGSETLVSGVKVGDPRIDKAVSRGLESLKAAGCASSDPIIPAVKPAKSPSYPDKVPGVVVDALRAKVKRVR